jgi:O-antigen ligase
MIGRVGVMRWLAGTILTAYALLISFGSAFALHRWVPLPLAVLLVGGVALLVSLPFGLASRIRAGYFGSADLLLVGFSALVGLRVVFAGGARSKNLTHALAYTAVILIYSLFVKFLFAVDGAGIVYRQRIRGALALSTLVVSCYALAEFIDVNWLHAGFTRMVPFPLDTKPYDPRFFIFTRARGFEGESAFLALFLNIFLPLSYVWVRSRLGRLAAVVFLACGACAFAVTFSAAGLVGLVLGLCTALGLYLSDHAFATLPLRGVVMASALAVLAIAGAFSAPPQVREAVWAKVTFAAGPTSAGKRLAAWKEAIPVAADNPFLGIGVGSTSEATGEGVVSFYLTMLKEAGIPALILIVSYLLLALAGVVRLSTRSPYKYAYAIAMVSAILQYAAISDIWFPWLWLLCILIADEGVAVDSDSEGSRTIA